MLSEYLSELWYVLTKEVKMRSSRLRTSSHQFFILYRTCSVSLTLQRVILSICNCRTIYNIMTYIGSTLTSIHASLLSWGLWGRNCHLSFKCLRGFEFHAGSVTELCIFHLCVSVCPPALPLLHVCLLNSPEMVLQRCFQFVQCFAQWTSIMPGWRYWYKTQSRLTQVDFDVCCFCFRSKKTLWVLVDFSQLY